MEERSRRRTELSGEEGHLLGSAGDQRAVEPSGEPAGARSGGRPRQSSEERSGRPRQSSEERSGRTGGAAPSSSGAAEAQAAALIEAQSSRPPLVASPCALLPGQIFEGLGSGAGSGGSVHQGKERARDREPLQPAMGQPPAAAGKRARGEGGGAAPRPRGESPCGARDDSVRQLLGATGENVRQPTGGDGFAPANGDGPRVKGAGASAPAGGRPRQQLGDMCIVATLMSSHVKPQVVARLKRLCSRLGGACIGVDVGR